MAAVSISEVFGGLRKTASALERDCLELRTKVEEPFAATGVNVLGCIGSITDEMADLNKHSHIILKDKSEPLSGLLEVCRAVFASNNSRLDKIEAHIEQYGYVRPEPTPPVITKTEDSESPSNQGEQDIPTLERERTWTAEEEEEVDEPATAEPDATETPEECAAKEPPQAEEADELDALLHADDDDIALPSLKDLGFSSATLAMLSKDDSHVIADSPIYDSHSLADTPTFQESELPTSMTMPVNLRSGTAEDHPMVQQSEAPRPDSVDVLEREIDPTMFGITSVAVLGATESSNVPDATGDEIASSAAPVEDTNVISLAEETTEVVDDPDLNLYVQDTLSAPTSVAIMESEPLPQDQQVEEDAEDQKITTEELPPQVSEPEHFNLDMTVSDEEYNSMPHFITLMLSLDELNAALAMIKDCICATDAPASEVIFTQSQLSDELDLGVKAKPVLLILLKLQRLEAHGKNDAGDAMYSFRV